MDQVPNSIPLADITRKKKRTLDPEAQDRGSILSDGLGDSKESFDENTSVTCQDIKLIMPTVIILLFTLLVMLTVIPYAFSSVIKQLQAVWALEELSEGDVGDMHGFEGSAESGNNTNQEIIP